MITKIVVHGDAEDGPRGDQIWAHCSIDDNNIQSVKIIVRRFLTDGHPLTVYINGARPLYPTVVYDVSGRLLATCSGLVES